MQYEQDIWKSTPFSFETIIIHTVFLWVQYMSFILFMSITHLPKLLDRKHLPRDWFNYTNFTEPVLWFLFIWSYFHSSFNSLQNNCLQQWHLNTRHSRSARSRSRKAAPGAWKTESGRDSWGSLRLPANSHQPGRYLRSGTRGSCVAHCE